MHDRVVVLAGLGVLALGLLVFFTPIGFKVSVEVTPLVLGGIIVLALGALILLVGIVSFATRQMQE